MHWESPNLNPQTFEASQDNPKVISPRQCRSANDHSRTEMNSPLATYELESGSWLAASYPARSGVFVQRVAVLGMCLFQTILGFGSDWQGFRGDGSSISASANLPLHWSNTNGVRWRAKLPGPGQSSPVIWHEIVVVTCVLGRNKETNAVVGLDLHNGRERWRFTSMSSGPEELSDMRSQGAPTPLAADDGVFALFESGDLYALNPNGTLRWQKSLAKEHGRVDGNHGLGGSPALFKRTLLVPLDQKGPSCLLAFDRTTGAQLWKAARRDRVSWSTPLVAKQGGRYEAIVNGGGSVVAYDVETGEQLWEAEGIKGNNLSSPTLSEGILLIGSSAKGENLAFDLRTTTNLPPILWRADEATSGFGSPLAHRGRAYWLNKVGVLTAYELKSGGKLFEERVAEGSWASPLGAGDRFYCFGEKGITTVLAATDNFLPLATNRLEITTRIVGVAAANKVLVLRSYDELLCIGQPLP